MNKSILKDEILKQNKFLIILYVLPIVFAFLLSVFTTDYSNPFVALILFLFICSLFLVIGTTGIFIVNVFKMNYKLFSTLIKEMILKIIVSSLILLSMYISLYSASFILQHMSRGISIYGMYATLNNYGLNGTLFILFIYTFMFCLQLLFITGFTISFVRILKKPYKRILQILVFTVLVIVMFIAQMYFAPVFIQEQELGFNIFYLMRFIGELNQYLYALFIQTILLTIVIVFLTTSGMKIFQKYS